MYSVHVAKAFEHVVTSPATSRAVIRDATAADVPRILAMGRRFYAASPYAAVAGYSDAAAADLVAALIAGGVLLVAEHHSEVVGMIGLHVTGLAFDPATLTATEVMWWVEPEARGLGVAVDLRCQAEARCRARGCRWIAMSVLAGSPAHATDQLATAGYHHFESSFLLEL
ncbi:GNAT family N-acetyltransferase [Luteimonas changyuni]|uniref:GNAT family N-acetyltransferase n=1 Tax=Luteimonas sp. MJ145 TaxID=3129234 RepID=UPI0031BB5ED9